MASTDPWYEFELIRHNVKHNTVDRLKQIVIGLNDECGVYLPKTGKKQEIIDRIGGALENWKQQDATDKWAKAKNIIQTVRLTGIYQPRRLGVASGSSSNLPAASHAMPGYGTTFPHSSAPPPARYDPYASSRRPTAPNGTPASVTTPISSLTAKQPSLRFKDSPFFSVDQVVSSVVECPESNSSTDRRQQTVVFTLTPDQINLLKSANPKYQLRLFCTSSAFHSPNPTFRTSSAPALIEFPPTCEVRVNNVQLSANLKGLKKKPGTAPPPDLGRYVRLNNTANKVEMVYVNSQQPVHSKKFYLVVMLVKVTSIDFLVDRLKKEKYVPADDVLAKMRLAISGEDDDIIAGPVKMSLKCPLSFMRVNTPCRSSKCVHPQCFDATSWYSMMEQTTTWLCPVCEKTLDTNDLIIDGYFDDIVKQCPEIVEDVLVEADGEWHTADNKFGSAAWKAQHPPSKPASIPPTPRKPLSSAKSPSQCNVKSPNGKSKADLASIMILDSDDEEEDRVKQELSPSFASGSQTSIPAPPQQSDVIDLTLDESDDEEPPRQTGKRKASDAPSPTENIWKKSRTVSVSDRSGASSNLATGSRRSDYSQADPLTPASHGGATRYGAHSTSSIQPLYPPIAGVNTRPNGSPETERTWRLPPPPPFPQRW